MKWNHEMGQKRLKERAKICSYCEVKLTKNIFPEQLVKALPSTHATFDHLFSRSHGRKSRMRDAIVISCYKCNKLRNLVEQGPPKKNFSAELLVFIEQFQTTYPALVKNWYENRGYKNWVLGTEPGTFVAGDTILRSSNILQLDLEELRREHKARSQRKPK